LNASAEPEGEEDEEEAQQELVEEWDLDRERSPAASARLHGVKKRG
jgi:hypothetical protein